MDSVDGTNPVGARVDSDAPTAADPERAPAPELAPLSKRFRIGEVLGRGGMGEVVAAYDTVLGRDVAIKRLISTSPSARLLTRFFREARIQGRLDHPTIPPVHELGRDELGLPYFVMKRLVGMTLAKILDRLAIADPETTRQFPLQRLLRAFVDVCLAMELAHTRGIIHRDIKPSNVILGDFGDVSVIDWGVAKVLADLDPAMGPPEVLSEEPDAEVTAPGTVIGTPGYMAPEQRHGDDVDARADIFALGCVLFEILTRNRVPEAASLKGAIDPLQYASNVSPELAALCVRATAPIPAARIPTARMLGDLVQRYLDGDRDVALRVRLSAEHYARAAKAAFDIEHGQGDLQLAMREAGRALALDPNNASAAHLIGRVMLEPPRRLPKALDDELTRASEVATMAQARRGIGAYLAIGLFVPHMVWAGVREPGYLVALVAMLSLLIGHALLGTRLRTLHYPNLATGVSLGFSTALVAIMARMYSPFIIAPAVAALSSVVLMGVPLFRRRWVVPLTITLMTAGVVVPYLLEACGVLSATTIFTGHSVVLENLALDLPAVPTAIGLVAFVIGYITVAAMISRTVATHDADAQRRLQIQAWQLRQLVPEPT